MITPILVLCEGESDEAFLDELIEKKRLKGIAVWRLQLQIEPKDPTGVGGFAKRLQGLLAETGLEACKLVMIMADNDDEPDRKFRDVLSQIKKAGLFGIPENQRVITKPDTIPPGRHIPDIAVLMLPWDDSPGAIETMCFNAGSAMRPPLAKCIRDFTKCAKVSSWPISKLSKLQVRCMLAVLCQKNPDISFKWSWKKGNKGPSVLPWPATHKEFSGIGKYLRELLKQIK